MPTRLMVRPEELQYLSAQLRQVVAEQEVLSQKTQAIISSLKGAWEGDFTTTYTKAYDSILADERKKIALLIYLANALTEASQAMMQYDASIVSSSVFEK